MYNCECRCRWKRGKSSVERDLDCNAKDCDIFGLLDLLLGAELVAVAALLSAVVGLRVVASVALAANQFVLVGFTSQHHECRLNNASAQTKHKVECAFLLDVVVGEGAPIFELLPSEDQALLIRGDALFVLDLSLDIFDGIARLNLEGDGLSREGLYEDLHRPRG